MPNGWSRYLNSNVHIYQDKQLNKNLYTNKSEYQHIHIETSIFGWVAEKVTQKMEQKFFKKSQNMIKTLFSERYVCNYQN